MVGEALHESMKLAPLCHKWCNIDTKLAQPWPMTYEVV